MSDTELQYHLEVHMIEDRNQPREQGQPLVVVCPRCDRRMMDFELTEHLNLHELQDEEDNRPEQRGPLFDSNRRIGRF